MISRLLMFGSIAFVSVLPVSIFWYWQYQLAIDSKLSLSGDSQQIPGQLVLYFESLSEAFIMTVVLGIVIACVLGWLLAIATAKQLRRFVDTAKTVAEGDFTTRVSISMKYRSDELQELEDSFNQMIEQLGKADTELNNTRELAEKINRSKSGFRSKMSHELQSHLDSIIGFAQELRSDTIDPMTIKQESLIKKITNSGEHLSKLISQIHDLEQGEEGDFSFTLDSKNPAEVIDERQNITETLAVKRSTSKMNNAVAENLPVIKIDATQLKQVLYIEDNLLNAELMEVIFDSVPNAELTIARSGELGVKLAKELSPDLILMDIFLPGIDGIEASYILKNSNRTAGIPIIAISAEEWDVDARHAKEVGFFAYLTKPINIPETLNTIEKALNPEAVELNEVLPVSS